MMDRRQMLMSLAEASEQVGIFTKGYEATLNPEAVNSFTITHNLGVIPRFVCIEIDDSTRQLTNSYIINAMIDFDVKGLPSGKTGAFGFYYHYSNDYPAIVWLPDTKCVATETTLTFTGYPYGTSRSRWDTDADYHVRIWG